MKHLYRTILGTFHGGSKTGFGSERQPYHDHLTDADLNNAVAFSGRVVSVAYGRDGKMLSALIEIPYE